MREKQLRRNEYQDQEEALQLYSDWLLTQAAQKRLLSLLATRKRDVTHTWDPQRTWGLQYSNIRAMKKCVQFSCLGVVMYYAYVYMCISACIWRSKVHFCHLLLHITLYFDPGSLTSHWSGERWFRQVGWPLSPCYICRCLPLWSLSLHFRLSFYIGAMGSGHSACTEVSYQLSYLVSPAIQD